MPKEFEPFIITADPVGYYLGYRNNENMVKTEENARCGHFEKGKKTETIIFGGRTYEQPSKNKRNPIQVARSRTKP